MTKPLALEIKRPALGQIIVCGPTGIGKSIVMDRIEKSLQEEFFCAVVSKDLHIERNSTDFDSLEPWEKKLVTETIWNLQEINIPE